jgi:hypothetical protein
MLHIIRPHSFVDLITNSSSELFVCNTTKSVDAVKKVLVELVKLENQKNALKDTKHRSSFGEDGVYGETEEFVFTNFFKEPAVAEFSFIQENFPRYEEYMSANSYYNRDLEGKFEVYRIAHKKICEWQLINKQPQYKNNMTDVEQAAYDEYHHQYRLNRRKFFKEWNTYTNQLELDFYQWAFEEAGLNKNLLTVDFEDEYPRVQIADSVPTKDAADTAEEFRFEIEMALSYHYNFNKGDILLWSQSDNSVPYGLFDSIEYVLNAHRIHAG